MSSQNHSEAQERGRRIREMRRKKGLTTKQMAKLLGVNTGTISRYETGITKGIKEPMLQAIAQYLDTNAYYLNTGKELKEAPAAEKTAAIGMLEAPVPPYHRVLKQSQTQEILKELEAIRKNAAPACEGRKTADADRLIMVAETESAELQILRQDQLSILPCEQLVPEKVNLVLDADGKIRFFRALKTENTALLQISKREALSGAALAKHGLKLIAYCVKLTRKNV